MATSPLPAPPFAPTGDDRPSIEVRNLSKRFGKTQALFDVSLSVPPGEMLGLIGPNGSGKTTLLRCLTGLLLEDSGSTTIAGHDLHKDPIPVRRMLAYIPEIPQPFAYLTPAEHLLFVAKAYSLPPTWEPRAKEILHELDLDEKEKTLALELSKGQRQKVHMAMVMLRDPKVLVLDEPLIGIDPKGAYSLKRWVKERSARGACGIVSSHSLALVEEVCHRVAILSKGRVIASGTFEEIRRQAGAAPGTPLEEVFLAITAATPPMGAGHAGS